MQVEDRTFDDLLEVWISLARNIEGREEIANETHEHRKIIGDDLWNVEISQRTHQNLSTSSRKHLMLVQEFWKRSMPVVEIVGKRGLK